MLRRGSKKFSQYPTDIKRTAVTYIHPVIRYIFSQGLFSWALVIEISLCCCYPRHSKMSSLSNMFSIWKQELDRQKGLMVRLQIFEFIHRLYPPVNRCIVIKKKLRTTFRTFRHQSFYWKKIKFHMITQFYFIIFNVTNNHIISYRTNAFMQTEISLTVIFLH